MPIIGGANSDAAHARIYSGMEADRLILKGQLRNALTRLEEGGWPDPFAQLLERVARKLSNHALFLHWLHPQNADGSWSQIEVQPIKPEAWHGPN